MSVRSPLAIGLGKGAFLNVVFSGWAAAFNVPLRYSLQSNNSRHRHVSNGQSYVAGCGRVTVGDGTGRCDHSSGNDDCEAT